MSEGLSLSGVTTLPLDAYTHAQRGARLPTTRGQPAQPEWDEWIRFERVVPEKNCYREYEISIAQDLFGEWAVIRSWGRIGGRQRQMATSSPTRDDAIALAKQIARRRLSHGYRVAVSG